MSELEAFGHRFTRLGGPIRAASRFEAKLADGFVRLFTNQPGVVPSDPSVETYRSPERVVEALEKPRSERLSGETVILCPGTANAPIGPAQVARFLVHGATVFLCRANPFGDGADLGPLDELGGMPLPPDLVGRLHSVGSSEPLIISFEQASDLLIEQWSRIWDLGQMPAEDPGTSAPIVIGYGQGALAAMLARRRCHETLGRDLLSRLVAVAGPFRGSWVSDESMIGLITESLEPLSRSQALHALNLLDPHRIKKRVSEDDERWVDLAVVARTDATSEGPDNLRAAFRISDAAIEARNFPRAVFRALVRRDPDAPELRENDGLVTVASQKFGRRILELDRSYDHAGVAEDPSLVDALIEVLGGVPGDPAHSS